ncbi:hypothetical protein JZ751_013635, partial [Albula glossodonta]
MECSVPPPPPPFKDESLRREGVGGENRCCQQGAMRRCCERLPQAPPAACLCIFPYLSLFVTTCISFSEPSNFPSLSRMTDERRDLSKSLGTKWRSSKTTSGGQPSRARRYLDEAGARLLSRGSWGPARHSG